MERPHQRPRFSFTVPLAADAVMTRLAGALEGADGPCIGSVSARHCWIHIRRDARHFWSPSLDLSVAESDGGARIQGRFAPHPSIWTMFMFIYAVLGLATVLGLVFGAAQVTMGSAPWALLGAGAGVALIGFVYGATFIGQGLGAEQMAEMRLFLERTVGPGQPED